MNTPPPSIVGNENSDSNEWNKVLLLHSTISHFCNFPPYNSYCTNNIPSMWGAKELGKCEHHSMDRKKNGIPKNPTNHVMFFF